MLLKLVLIIGILYLLLCVFLYFKQESLIFRPTYLPPDYSFDHYSNFEELYFPIEKGKIHALHFKTENPKGVILYFHGNSEALESWGAVAEDFTKNGYEVLMPDYRTYGKSTGTLSQNGLYKDALMVFEYLKKSWSPDQIIIYGRSLGTGIGTELATLVKAKLLILETPYTSMSAMANKTVPFVPIKWLMKYQLRNIVKMKKLKCKVHIFAGTEDMLTPYKHAVALAKKTDYFPSSLTTIQGAGHNNIAEFPLYHSTLTRLLHT